MTSSRSRTLSNWGMVSFVGSEHDRLRPQPYFSSAHGSVYYTPDHRRRGAATPSFPTPLIQPRQRRPHSIHIVSYPSGYIPPDLRPDLSAGHITPPPGLEPSRAQRSQLKREAKQQKKREKAKRKADEKAARERGEKRRSIRSLPPAAGERVSRVFEVIDKILSALSVTAKPSVSVSTTPKRSSRPHPSSFAGFARQLSRVEPSVFNDESIVSPPEQQQQPSQPRDEQLVAENLARQSESTMAAVIRPPLVASATNAPNRNSMMSMRSAKSLVNSSVTELPKPVASGSGLTCSIILAEPNVFLTGFEHDGHARQESQNSSALLRGKLQLNVSKNVKIKSVTLKLVGKARTEWPEGIPPLKTELFEEQTLRTQSLVFFHAMHEGMWETEYGSQCNYTIKAAPQSHSTNIRNSFYSTHSNGSFLHSRSRNSSNLTAKELKRLSLQSVNSRSFGKGDSPLPHQVQAKGYKVFVPGTYEYTFELPIDHNQLETTKLQYGSIKWELETTVERAGAFKPNLHGTKEVPVVRLPDQMSLEMTEPISISRQWEDQLHYDIMISGKSFPIGTKIPIAFKLTPLAKVQVHKLKVFVTESIEYWTNDRRVTRKDNGRKILLLEKTAGKPLDKQYSGSDIRILSGGELSREQREEARASAMARRVMQASRENRSPEPLPSPTDNLLGDLDLGLETFWGSTEIEMNVQIPTCETMARDKALRLHPDCSWKNVNVYHWIKIVMRISRADPDDPTGRRRRHFEISIDSPFTVLNCRATQANTLLPQYCGREGPQMAEQRHQMSCGCPDAAVLDRSPSSSTAHLALVEQDPVSANGSRLRLDRVSGSNLPTTPQAAHLQGPPRLSGPSRSSTLASIARDQQLPSPVEPRPIHLLRHPSFNPPAFDADDPPPPLPLDVMTPPPNYDIIVGTPSVDGLADYFARLADYEDPSGLSRLHETSGESTPLASATGSAGFFSNTDPFAADARTRGEHPADDGDSSDSADEDPARPHRRGRVNVANPRTPGGRLVPSRSLEIERPVIRLDMTNVARRP
ncbi:Arrestin (or S-antigen), C-terminal domain containing protein [Rhypophila decipiens]